MVVTCFHEIVRACVCGGDWRVDMCVFSRVLRVQLFREEVGVVMRVRMCVYACAYVCVLCLRQKFSTLETNDASLFSSRRRFIKTFSTRTQRRGRNCVLRLIHLSRTRLTRGPLLLECFRVVQNPFQIWHLRYLIGHYLYRIYTTQEKKTTSPLKMDTAEGVNPS